jgi:hypothetical protein
MTDPPTRQSALERPVGLPAASNALFGSDAIAEALRDLRIPFIPLNPGASYRGACMTASSTTWATKRHKCVRGRLLLPATEVTAGYGCQGSVHYRVSL